MHLDIHTYTKYHELSVPWQSEETLNMVSVFPRGQMQHAFRALSGEADAETQGQRHDNKTNLAHFSIMAKRYTAVCTPSVPYDRNLLLLYSSIRGDTASSPHHRHTRALGGGKSPPTLVRETRMHVMLFEPLLLAVVQSVSHPPPSFAYR